MRRGVTFDEKERLTLALDVADGMRFLHHSQILHRDLKSMNVLITSENRAKIADFGLSKSKSSMLSHVTGMVGTFAWAAPENLRDRIYRESSDVYSFGVILWELVTNQIPWGKFQSQLVYTNVNDLSTSVNSYLYICFYFSLFIYIYSSLFVNVYAILFRHTHLIAICRIFY